MPRTDTHTVSSRAPRGTGSHVNMVTDQICKKLVEHLKAKKKTTLKPFQVKNHLWVFVNALIENPAFDSQTKVNLSSKPSSFGSKCSFDDKTMKQIIKCGVVENILDWAKMKQSSDMRRKDGAKKSKISIPKLDDANDAGGRNASRCTLILTEGDSAKALAISGLGVVGRDQYGVFPLRGKLLNVREASHAQVRAWPPHYAPVARSDPASGLGLLALSRAAPCAVRRALARARCSPG